MGVGVNWNLGYDPGGGGTGTYSGGGINIPSLESILSKLPGATPWFANPLAQFGGSLLGGLSNLLSGPSQAQRSARSVFNLAQNRLGQSVLDPSQYLAQYMQALAPRFTQQSERIGSRLGLDSGLAQKALAGQQQSTLSGVLADLEKFNAQATANQDMGLLQLMLNAGARS